MRWRAREMVYLRTCSRDGARARARLSKYGKTPRGYGRDGGARGSGLRSGTKEDNSR